MTIPTPTSPCPKNFPSFADHELRMPFLSLFLCRPLGFTLGGLLVGPKTAFSASMRMT